MTWLSPSPVPPRTYELPDVVAQRLDTPILEELLGGPGRVFAKKDEPMEQEGQPSEAWGRVVVQLGERIVPAGQEHGTRRATPRVLVRAEVNRPGPGFDPSRALEAIHAEVFQELEGWTPVVDEASVAWPLWRVGMVNAEPLWDDERGLWLKTAEYRLVLGPVT